jgi:hypothetical protein
MYVVYFDRIDVWGLGPLVCEGVGVLGMIGAGVNRPRERYHSSLFLLGKTQIELPIYCGWLSRRHSYSHFEDNC